MYSNYERLLTETTESDDASSEPAFKNSNDHQPNIAPSASPASGFEPVKNMKQPELLNIRGASNRTLKIDIEDGNDSIATLNSRL